MLEIGPQLPHPSQGVADRLGQLGLAGDRPAGVLDTIQVDHSCRERVAADQESGPARSPDDVVAFEGDDIVRAAIEAIVASPAVDRRLPATRSCKASAVLPSIGVTFAFRHAPTPSERHGSTPDGQHLVAMEPHGACYLPLATINRNSSDGRLSRADCASLRRMRPPRDRTGTFRRIEPRHETWPHFWQHSAGLGRS